MTRFRSVHYPETNNGFMLSQEYAMRYYAIFSLIVMVGVLVLISSGKPVLWFALIGEGIALVIANAAAQVSLRKRYAELFFVNQHISLISVQEILSPGENFAFPLMYTNPTRSENEITIHFNDQIVTLKREDWEDFDLIWDWLTSNN
ncbi:MAG: hypothetical protein AAGI38_01660 [Bacteroidota bacterium]